MSNAHWLAHESPFLGLAADGVAANFSRPAEAGRYTLASLLESPFLETEVGIVGNDERIRVTPTTVVPWRWICRVEITAKGRSQPVGSTGVLVSNRHVLTAAHVVHDAAQNMQNYSIRVVPALDYGTEPFGSYMVSDKPKVHPNYDPAAADRTDWDYALLKLDTAAGAKTFGKDKKPLCFWGNPQCGGNSVIARVDPASLNTKAVLSGGYPSGKDGRKLVCAPGHLHSVTRASRTMLTTIDLSEGQSGSPIWYVENGKVWMVGIAVSISKNANFALRVTREVIRQLRAWIVADGETPTMVDN